MHRHTTTLELQTEVRENFTITEKAPTRGAFNQEKALVWAFSVITNLPVDLCFKLYWRSYDCVSSC